MKILVIGHDALITGAPKFLLNFCRWITQHTGDTIEIILGKGGPLEKAYRDVAPVLVWETLYNKPRLRHRLWRKLTGIDRRKAKIRSVVHMLKQKKFDVIFCNTSVNGHILAVLSELNIPVVTRVPELGVVMSTYYKSTDSIDQTFAHSRAVVAVSEAVRENILNRYNFDPSQIYVCYGTVPRIDRTALRPDAVREALHLGSHTFVCGGCGFLGWRKGTDLFLATALYMKRYLSVTDVKFIWIGGMQDSPDYHQLLADVALYDLQDMVTITGVVDNPHDHLACCDVFLMTSREDPFPLVNLEAAQLGLPILGFDRTGGTPELLALAGIEPVPYADVIALANRIVTLKDDDALRNRAGQRMKEVADSQFDFEKSVARIHAIIKATTTPQPISV